VVKAVRLKEAGVATEVVADLFETVPDFTAALG
jgi:hypothetical protein